MKSSAIIILDNTQTDKDMEILMSALKYFTERVENGKFKGSSVMFSKPTEAHIHEFYLMDKINNTSSRFVKCKICNQCFPITGA